MSALTSYHDLIANKRAAFEPRGFHDVDEGQLPGWMFDHQRHGVAFALRTGASALFYDTGLGKTGMALAWGDEIVRRTNKPVLMLAPLAVASQHVAEAEKFGIDARLSRFGVPPDSPRIAVTNYDRLEKFDPDDYAGVILDECFAPDTPIDVVDDGQITQRHIEDVQVGDIIVNAAGFDVVSDIHRREVPYAVKVSYGGHDVISSPNHPFFTQRGWISAQDIEPGDEIVAAAEAVRMVRRAIHGEVRAGREDEILRAILLSEMADESAGASGEGSYTGGGRKTRPKESRVARWRQSGRSGRDGTHRRAQSHVSTRGEGKVLPPIERDRARTFRAWGQWTGYDVGAICADGCVAREMGAGVGLVVGPTDSRISHALQARLGERRATSRYRAGWSLTPIARTSRHEEGREARGIRVDGIEVLELGHPELDRYRDAEGKLYFYDLGGTRHPSFSIHGGLVHNSSILKSFSGATTRKLIEAFAKTPYRLCCSATPAPNDHTELGQHSEFLGALDRNQMLVRWFLHDSADTGTWRMKGHAVTDFWNWVASWARAVSKPSDLGFSDAGFDMPKLVIERHIIAADRSVDAGFEKRGKHAGQGMLFRIPDTSATSIHAEKRLTSTARAQKVAELINADPDEPWIVWVDTDYDADAVRAAIPGIFEVSGKMKIDQKEERLAAFSRGEINRLLTKPGIAGYGLNWQHCARMAFCGISFSYESFYQAVRRCWRFRQARPVHAHIVCADTEAAIWDVVSRKAGDHDAMKAEMTAAMKRAAVGADALLTYSPNMEARLPAWLINASS